MSTKYEQRKAILDAVDIDAALAELGIEFANKEIYKQNLASKRGSDAEVQLHVEAAESFLLKEKQKENEKLNKKLDAENKLLKLGITKEELRLLLE